MKKPEEYAGDVAQELGAIPSPPLDKGQVFITLVVAAVKSTFARKAREIIKDSLEAAAAKAKQLGRREDWKCGACFQYEECPEELAADIAEALRKMAKEV